ncbi:glycosyltransferase family 4 protein [Salinisphaera aquimarina]|uniref:Glycosyltransferase family 4 protein n=1 Tax=Salinisphaera aquimarina TaxID=2094031 RepID=A0ABV7EP79_9GAMM
MSPACAEAVLIVAGDPHQLTGGYLYDAHIVDGLRERGHSIRVVGLDGTFPEPDATARQALDDTLAAIVDHAIVVIDGLAMGALPEVIERHADRLCVIALVHHPLADETGLDANTRDRLLSAEQRALAAVTAVVVTSVFTARRLEELDIRAPSLTVVEPGVAPAAAAPDRQEGPCRLLCVATLIPRKGHDVLVAALSGLSDLDWQCECVGALDRDPAYADAVAAQIEDAHLSERLRLRGPLEATELNDAYARSDLFVLPSHYEGYGMVILEALAHGLPIVTTTGGALADTLPADCGLAVPPGDTAALHDALRTLIVDRDARHRAQATARAARDHLRRWPQAANEFGQLLDTLDRRGGSCA